jgi:adenosylhomocysteine nucleosidase
MKIGIMGAMTEEIKLLVPEIRNENILTIGGRNFISGKMLTHEVVLVFSRMGKVAASSTSTILIDRFHVDLLILTGVAGAIDPSLGIGDVVVADSLVQHDMDVSALSEFKRFEIPLLGKQFLDPPSDLVEKAFIAAKDYIRQDMPKELSPDKLKAFGISTPEVVKGMIGSGDQFIASVEKASELRSLLPGLQCVEMEGAAIAQVAVEHDIPFIVFRTISDKADHSAHIDFPKFIRLVAAHITCGCVKRLVSIL